MHFAFRVSRCFFRLFAFLCFAVFIPALGAGWNDHPALEQFQLDSSEYPEILYLVRTRGELPETEGLTLHGENNGIFLVSGEEEDVLFLNQLGCGVFPLEKPSLEMNSPVRSWSQISSADPLIEEILSGINWTDLADRIQWLVDFGTRYSLAPNHLEVAEEIGWIFQGYGLSPEYHSFDYNGITLWNVLATQTGTLYPDSFFIVCAHYDSISENPMVSAPGADDNGTGTAIILLAADILSGYSFKYSIVYICFAGEEQGLRGSQAYANWAAASGMGIVGVMNFDMLGYWEEGVEADLEVESNEASVWLADAILNAAELYTETPYELHVYNGAWWGDHASFWAEGFSAVNHEEAWDWGDPDFNPYYHSTSDLLEYVGEDFMVGNARLGIAALATLAQPDCSGGSVAQRSDECFSSALLEAYPNPFSNQIDFKVTGMPAETAASIELYDIAGRCVFRADVPLSEGTGNFIWIPGDDLERSGVFFARITGSNMSDSARLVRIR